MPNSGQFLQALKIGWYLTVMPFIQQDRKVPDCLGFSRSQSTGADYVIDLVYRPFCHLAWMVGQIKEGGSNFVYSLIGALCRQQDSD